MTRPKGEHAVVLGGSIAGLLAARTLADHFARVTILERDPLASDSRHRRGAPQARHTHGLLAGGLQAIERLFPGIRRQLESSGASPGDLLASTRWYLAGGFHVQHPSGLVALGQSRLLLEETIRSRVRALPNVAIRDEISVERLVTDYSQRDVIGVQLTDRRQNSGELLRADLIVDATGRGSRTPGWLAELGYDPPVEDRIEMTLMYATQLFRRQPGDLGGNLAVVIPAEHPCKRSGVALAIDGDRWSVTLAGMANDVPATEPTAFRHFARTLPTPVLADFLATAEPLSEIETYRYPASIRRRYEQLSDFPGRYVVMGDALCSFNPVYGQGMSVAAMEAELLGQCVCGGLDRIARRFFRTAAKIVDTPWQIAAAADLEFPHVRGDRSWSARWMNAYVRLVHQAAHHDPTVAIAFHRVANLLDRPANLLRPRVAARVLAAWWRKKPGSQRRTSHVVLAPTATATTT
jgi:2-polyprenyl-6-methoxyphenol hydroxylase-like FAD-dependent oxidoreductase